MLGPERLRSSSSLRALVRENHLRVEDLILPIFLNSQDTGKKAIASLPGVFQWSLKDSIAFISEQYERGLRALILFGVVESARKTENGAMGWDPDGPVPKALRLLRKKFPDMILIADACLCEYTDHGHCGTFSEVQGLWQRQHLVSLEDLRKVALCYAEAGANIIAPSGMADGMVASIRSGLNAGGFERVGICSYAVKYASSYYGPFRDAAESAPKAGTDRKAYQMDSANRLEAIREAELDIAQGADMLLVKPGQPYLDIVRDVANISRIPVGVYQVSGEYALIKAGAEKGWISEDAAFMESLIGMKRAGAKFIISYWAPRAAELLAGASS